MKIVITGNMGCGKSTAVSVIHRALPDYTLFDFDQTVAEMYQNQSLQFVLDHMFGTHDRAKVSDIVHNDPEAMKKLTLATDAFLLTSINRANKEVNVIFDIPLYFEYNDKMGLTPDVIICVTSDIEDQIERVKRRSGFTEEKIRTILAKQLPQQEKVDKSDFVLHNRFSSKEEFELYVEDFVNKHKQYGVLSK